MKIGLILILPGLTFIILSACQPQTAVKTEETATVDSAFYYVQKDIDDPFLDTVFQAPDPSIALKKELYPPPEQKPKFKEIEGFRIQIFAGVDTVNALSTRAQAKTIVSDSVYLLDEQGLLKVQVGDYPYRYQADKVRDQFRREGFPGAWVILRTILIPFEADSTETVQAIPDTATVVQPAKPVVEQGKYKIQIIAIGSEDRAQEIISNLKQNMNYQAFYERSGSLFKVFVGYFQEEMTAREALGKLRESGYPDAWLVY
jgi:cell division septation protein DedD